MKFDHICEIFATMLCRSSGQSVKQIARSAKRSPSTIRRWLTEGGYKQLRPILMRKPPLCPECEPECECEGRKLKFLEKMETKWEGTLRYWRCRCCRAKLVSINGGKLELAA